MSEQRKRSLDINKLSVEDAERISAEIGEEVRKICDEAVGKANTLLNIYGMKAKMAIVIEDALKKEESEVPKNKKARTKKAANL